LSGSADVEQAIKERLLEIEAQLQPLKQLEDEAARLRRALSAVRAEPPSAAPSGRSRRATRTPAGRRTGGQRAKRGSNLAAIVEHVQRQPGATAGQLAEATGIDRTVVYSAVARLTAAGRLQRRPTKDGQVGYHPGVAA
jgi:hypothetical protein